MLDAAEFALVNPWQRGFPLDERPFARIAAAARLTEGEVLETYRKLVAEGVIDRIGPVFRPNAVGASLLAAIAVPRERLEEVAECVSREPGVNHNYEREHRCNLWFVVTGETQAEVQASVSSIERTTGLRVLRLPLLEEFHIDLGFDLESHDVPRGMSWRRAFPPASAAEQALVRKTVRGLPLVPAPYAEIERQAGLGEGEAVGLLKKMLEDGRIRRIGAVIRHRRLGYQANAMVVWDVPDERASELGRALAHDPAVTLCYRRARSLPDWPYNLYCMVHGRERSRVVFHIERLCAERGLGEFARAVLFSTRCFSQRAASYG
jgi:DNA-binding Lrp family transcriptional regulator